MAVLNQSSVTNNVKLIDARGPRFSAVITTLVLAAALVTQSAALIAIQLVVFAGPANAPIAKTAN